MYCCVSNNDSSVAMSGIELSLSKFVAMSCEKYTPLRCLVTV